MKRKQTRPQTMDSDDSYPRWYVVKRAIDADDLTQFKRLVLDDIGLLEEDVPSAGPFYRRPFQYALYRGRLGIARWLVDHVPVEHFCESDLDHGNPVIFCCRQGYADMLESMLKRSPTLDTVRKIT